MVEGPPDRPPATPDDAEIVRRVLAGDEAAFARLVQQHHGAMVRLAHMFVSSSSVAHEVVQEAWMAVLAGLAGFEGRSALKTWIFRILTNRAKTRGVREGRSVPFSALARDDEPAVDPARFTARGHWANGPAVWEVTTPEELLQRKQAMRALEAALATLPTQQRIVVTLRDVDGWESADVCNVLEISETNQRVLLHRGRTKLRRLLAEHVSRS